MTKINTHLDPILVAAELYSTDGWTGERNCHPMPDADIMTAAIREMMEIAEGSLENTRLSDFVQPILWKMVNIFDTELNKLSSKIHDSTGEIRQMMRQQDGAEVLSNQLEALVNNARDMTDAEKAFEELREIAADQYHAMTGDPWMAARGTKKQRHIITSATVEASDFIKERKEIKQPMPEGSLIGVVGGRGEIKVEDIFKTLDRVKAKVTDMVLVHGGDKMGCDLIAAKWAVSRSVDVVICKPNWTKDGKRAGFLRNEKFVELGMTGMINFPELETRGVVADLISKMEHSGVNVYTPNLTPTQLDAKKRQHRANQHAQ